MIKALFLDRDGVINIDYGYVGTIDHLDFCENIFRLTRECISHGFHPFIITNQSGLARGYFDKHQFLNLMDYILNAFSLQNAPVTDYRFCPHMPSDFCSCRKPQPGMIFDLAKTYQIDLGRSLLIGDNMSDILCGVSAGVGARFLISGNNAGEPLPESTTVCSNLAEVMNTLAFKNFLNF